MAKKNPNPHDGQGNPPPEPETPQEPAVKPEPKAFYVLASGPQFGATVEVVPIGEGRAVGTEVLRNLALPESPDRVYQTLARLSDKKEPGTWHYHK